MAKLNRFLLALILSLASSFALIACDDGDSSTPAGDTEGDTTGDATTDTSGTTSGDTSGGDPCRGKTLCTDEGARSCATGPERIIECREDADGCLVEQASSTCAASETCIENAGSPQCVNPCADLPAADRCTNVNAKQCDGDTLETCQANTDNCLVWSAPVDCTTQTGSNVCGDVGGVSACVFDICADEADCTPGKACDGDTLTNCTTDASGCLVEETFDCTTVTGSTCDPTNFVCTTTGDICEGVDPADQCDEEGAMCNPENPDELWVCAPNAFGCLVAQATDCAALPGLPTGSTGFCDGTQANAAVCAVDPGDRCADEDLCDPTTDAVGANCNDDNTQLITCTYNSVGCLVKTTDTCVDADPDFVCVEVDADDDLCGDPPPACTDDCVAGTSACNANAVWMCAADGDADPCLELVQTADCTATSEVCDDSSGTAVCAANGSGESCDDALLITLPFAQTGDASAASDDLAGTTNCVTLGGNDLVFALNVTAGDMVHIREIGAASATVQVQTTCGDSACELIVGNPAGARGAIFMATADGMIYPSVEFTSLISTDYDLRVEEANLIDIGSFASGDTIPDTNSSEALVDGDSAFYSITFTDAVLLSGTIGGGTTGDADAYIYDDAGTLVQAFTAVGDETIADLGLPAGTYYIWVYAYLPDGDVDAFTISLSADAVVCGDTVAEGAEVCDDGNTDAGDGCAADCSAVETGYFCPPAGGVCIEQPDGDQCDTATALTEGTHPIDTSLGFTNDYTGYNTTECGGFARTRNGADQVFTVTVPAGERLNASLDTAGAYDGTLVLASDCAAILTSCEAIGAFTTNPQVVSFDNTGSTTDTVLFLIADGETAADAGTASLVIDFVAPGCGDGLLDAGEACDDGDTDDGDGCANDCTEIETGYACPTPGQACVIVGQGETCNDPIDLDALLGGASSGTFGPYSTSASLADYGPYNTTLCTDGDFFGANDGQGKDIVFSVTVPAGQTLNVLMDASFDEFLGILTDCGPVSATNCAYGSDAGIASYTNGTASDEVVFVVADGWSTTSAGTFSLDVELVTLEPEVCDDTIDNDGDGDLDCADSECTGAPECVGVCLVSGPRAGDLGSAVGASVATGTTVGGTNNYTATCGGSAGSPDMAYDWTAPTAGCFRFNTIGSSYDTVLHVKRCADGSQAACNDEGGTGITPQSQLDLTVAAGEELVVIVDGYSTTNSGTYVLNISACP